MMEGEKMLVNFKIGNYALFSDIIELDMKANTQISKHKNNVFGNGLIKTKLIYGPNNSGKTKLFHAIQSMKELVVEGNIENYSYKLNKNFLTSEEKIVYEVSFIDEELGNITFGLDVYQNNIDEFMYVDDELIYSYENNQLELGDAASDYLSKEIIDIMVKKKPNIIFLSKYDTFLDQNKYLEAVKLFFNKLVFYDNSVINDINMDDIIKFMSDRHKHDILNAFMKNADLRLLGREFKEVDPNNDITRSILKNSNSKNQLKTKFIKNFENTELMNVLRLQSVYETDEGDHIFVPSLYFDSLGTNKFANLIIVLINAIKENKLVFIDEIDSSFHSSLISELIVFINSEVNNKAQVVMTIHDTNVMRPELLRKDQIDFITREHKNVELYSLDDFKANDENNEKVRNTTIFEKKYLEGKFGALPFIRFYEVIKLFNQFSNGNQDIEDLDYSSLVKEDVVKNVNKKKDTNIRHKLDDGNMRQG
jgi:uncharacterized protein